MEGAGLQLSWCRSDMTCDSSGLESLSLGRLCSCSGSSDPSAESLRLRVEESGAKDDMLEELHVEVHGSGRSAEERQHGGDEIDARDKLVVESRHGRERSWHG